MTEIEEFVKTFKEIEARAEIYTGAFYPNACISGIDVSCGDIVVKLVEYSRCSCCPDDTYEFVFDTGSMNLTTDEYRAKLKLILEEKERINKEKKEQEKKVAQLEKEQKER